MQNVLPTPMSTLFTSSEIRKAVWTLKNYISPGMDQINVELIKYSPEVVYDKIADIYNNTAAIGKHANEITHGTLRALQKPGKPKGPISNFRPIILSSVFRIGKRINSRLESPILRYPYSSNLYLFIYSLTTIQYENQTNKKIIITEKSYNNNILQNKLKE